MTELTTTSGAALTTSKPSAPKVEAKDILIPKIFVLNPMSKLCAEEGLKPGSLVRSTDGKVIGDCELGVEFVPISYTKMWKVEIKKGGRYEHLRWEPVTPDNADLPWEWKEGLNEYRRNNSLMFYVMLTADIAREQKAMEALNKGEIPDVDDIVLPTCITFSRSGYKAGKVLLTHFAKTEEVRARGFDIPYSTKTFTLFGKKEKKDDATYYTLDVEGGAKASKEAMDVCSRWSTIISAGVQVHDKEEPSEGAPESAEQGNTDASSTLKF